MSFDGLRIGTSGIAAAQRAVETTAHNLANVNTDGYSRQRVETSTAMARVDHRGLLGPGATGQGVVIDGITRATDDLLASNLRDQMAARSSWEARADYTSRAEGILGPLEGGMSSALSSFWNSWEALSTDPEGMTARTAVVEAGRQVATSLNDAAARLDRLEGDTVADMTATVAEINDLAGNVAALNGQIAAARSSGNNALDLLNQRDLTVRHLTELTGARATTDANGDMRVSIAGMPLVQGNSNTPLAVAPTPTRVVWPDGSAAAPAGRLGALNEIVGAEISSLRGRIDEIAIELSDLVNTAHRAGFGLDGAAGRDFFVGTDATTLRIDPALEPAMVAASASGAPADGNHALEMGGLRNAATSTGATVNDLFNSVQGLLGLRSAEAARQERMSGAIVDELSTQLSATIGVSTDVELTDMLRYQRAYEASARVITVVDQMLDRLINGTGATR
ncbi:MAG: flagellar hook-associated protein FlgK [Acidimicrobiales bacterium]